MTQKPPGADPADPRGRHGPPTEVTWDEGQGRQPYANQGDEEAGPPNGGDEFAAGDRGEKSGHTREQLDEVTRKP